MKALRILVIAGIGLAAGLCRGADNYWQNAVGGSWETPGNWSLGVAPSNSDNPVLAADGTYFVNVNDTTANTDPGGGGSWLTASKLTVGDLHGLPTLAIDFTNASKTLEFTGDANVGDMAGAGYYDDVNGALVIDNGAVKVDGDARFGYRWFNSRGVLIMNNGLLTATTEEFGNYGTGEMKLYGGTNLVTGDMYFGSYGPPVSIGRGLVDGGTLICQGSTYGFYLGASGSGTLTVSNGIVNCALVRVSWFGSSYGEWNICGGTTTVGTVLMGFYLGSVGMINVSGGTLTADRIDVSDGQNVGTMNVSGGNVQSLLTVVGTGQAYGYGVGTLNITGGRLASSGGAGGFYVDDYAGCTGVVVVAGGTLSVADQNTYVGENYPSALGAIPGDGSLTVSSGFFHAGKDVYVGHYAGANGRLELVGGTSDMTNGTTYLGYYSGASGEMTVSNVAVPMKALTLAANSGAKGLLTLGNGGAAAISDALTVNAGGAITNRLEGVSGGLDLTNGVVLTVNDGGNIHIAVEKNAVDDSSRYWGLRWEGDHTAALQTLQSAGKLTWDADAARYPGSFRIAYDAPYTYVEFIAAPQGLLLRVE